MKNRPRILVCATGSVATIKVPELVTLLTQFADVKVVCTTAARHFLKEEQLPEAAKPILGDEQEWRMWQKKGDDVLHIELRRWADLLLIAPLSANSLAKVVHGLCDNLATCVVRAWDFTRPMLVAPAMNTFMWDNPLTAQQLEALRLRGICIIPPVAKTLACGDTGMGAMASPADIVAAVCAALQGAGHSCSMPALPPSEGEETAFSPAV